MSMLGLTSLMLALGTTWVGVLWIRPAIARARVKYEITRVRDRIMDGVLDGYLNEDSERARRALSFCELLTERPKSLNLGDALGVAIGFRKASPAVRKQIQNSQRAKEEEQHTAAGTRILQESEQEIDRIAAWHLVHSSILWWILEPLAWLAQNLENIVSAQGRNSENRIHPDIPGIARDMRRAYSSFGCTTSAPMPAAALRSELPTGRRAKSQGSSVHGHW